MHDKPFKYRYFLDNFRDCPPGDFEELDVTAYRWVFEDLTEERNFQPVLIAKPSRISDVMFQTETAKCQGYGLSFFDSLENARNRFERINAFFQERDQKFSLEVGTKVAAVSLNPTNGVGSKPSSGKSNKGQFTFHEYQYNNFFTQILDVENLLP